MESEVVKAFNAELVSLYELKPPISKKKIVDITKAFYIHIDSITLEAFLPGVLLLQDVSLLFSL
uniref:CID domain-containing protein n=1 Tax=Parascaris univalens TaxID=6257 RepID=A0A915ABA1_PARUN